VNYMVYKYYHGWGVWKNQPPASTTDQNTFGVGRYGYKCIKWWSAMSLLW
jgi:hypothetical protein